MRELINRFLLSKRMEFKNESLLYGISPYYGISIYYGGLMRQEVIHYPRLDTVLSVESVIKKAKQPISKNELDRRLEKKIMRATLNLILEYLEESGKIAVLKEGIIWIYKEDISNKLKAKLKKSMTAT